jgi:hypothetical protein
MTTVMDRTDPRAQLVAGAEGAVAVCRAERSTRALDEVAVELDALLSAATTGRDG